MSLGTNDKIDNYDSLYDVDEFLAVEKIRREKEGSMPVRNSGSEIRGRHRSKSHRRRGGQRPGGMHQRRIRKFD